MTPEEIIELARQVTVGGEQIAVFTISELESFTKLVAEKEREACAKYVESLYVGDAPLTTVMGAIGDAIRARNKHEN